MVFDWRKSFEQRKGDDLDPARGILLAVLVSAAVWGLGLTIGAIAFGWLGDPGSWLAAVRAAITRVFHCCGGVTAVNVASAPVSMLCGRISNSSTSC
jgi:hypothetical protein